MSEFDTVIWEASEEDEGDKLRLLYSSELDTLALQDATHDATVFLHPSTMASHSGAFLAWVAGVSLS